MAHHLRSRQPGRFNLFGQLLPVQHFRQFIDERAAGEEFDFCLSGQLDQAAGRALPEKSRHQDIGIDDQPHAPARALRARRTAFTSD